MSTAVACRAFAWLGQSPQHCDDCGKPYWDHELDEFQGRRTPISREAAMRCALQWGTDEQIDGLIERQRVSQ